MEVKIKKAKADSWLGLKQFSHTRTIIAAELDKMGYPVTGLTKAEEKEFEERLGLPEGRLAKTSDFWITYNVTLPNGELTLNTEIDDHELMYKFLIAQKKVSPSLSDLARNAKAKFVIYSEENEAKVANSRNKKKREAYVILDQMSPDEMRQMLMLYGKKSGKVNNEVVEANLTAEVELDPGKFVVMAKDPKLKDKVFVAKLVNAGILRKRGSGYYYGEDPLGYDLESTLAYFENKENNAMKANLKSQLKDSEK